MNYGGSDIVNMRRDALRRTREMHRQNTGHTAEHNSPVTEKKNDTAKNEPSQDKKHEGGINGFLSGIFSGGKPDNDKIIIIALIVILAREGADLKLLIALGYILM